MRKLVLALILAGFAVAPYPSQASTFDFSITNTDGNTNGTVTGVLDFSASSGTNLSATDVYITAAPFGGLSLPFNILTQTPDPPSANSFTISGGNITAANLKWEWGAGGTSPLWKLLLQTGDAENAFIYNGCTACIPGPGEQLILAFSATYTPVTATPLPAALPLFATALGGLGLLGWRRKRKASAALAAA